MRAASESKVQNSLPWGLPGHFNIETNPRPHAATGWTANPWPRAVTGWTAKPWPHAATGWPANPGPRAATGWTALI